MPKIKPKLDAAEPGLSSSAIAVPAVVPSVFHNSGPWTASSCTRYATLPAQIIAVVPLTAPCSVLMSLMSEADNNVRLSSRSAELARLDMSPPREHQKLIARLRRTSRDALDPSKFRLHNSASQFRTPIRTLILRQTRFRNAAKEFEAER